MSYCRWSSDFFQCDVYVYEDVMGGWTTHVAERRRPPMPDEIKAMFEEINWSDNDSTKKYLAATKRHRKWESTLSDGDWIDLSEIGPEWGETYNDPTPGECAKRLQSLKAKGFNVPNYAIDELLAEKQEMDGGKSWRDGQ